jgi:hypothetical protein
MVTFILSPKAEMGYTRLNICRQEIITKKELFIIILAQNT